MNRRKAIRTIATSMGAMVALPTWANAWSVQAISSSVFLSINQSDLLSEVVSSIIPEGQIVGAKGVGVPTFIEKMLSDCYDKNVQEDFKRGLEGIDSTSKQAYNQSFLELNSVQKLETLKQVSNSTDAKTKEFFGMLKNLTIQGYTTSEYVMVNHYRYEMAPGHYNGCISV